MPTKYQKGIQLTLTEDERGQKDRASYLFLREWLQNVIKNVELGSGLYLVSKNKGNGKTAWACKIMNEYFKKVALTNSMRCRGIFINVPTFLQDLRNNMDQQDDILQFKLDSILSADIVIWDDIGTENPTNWVKERLYGFINHRYSNNLTQIFTSNVLLEDLSKENFMGERIVSRIVGQCKIVEFFQSDRRADNG
jgi:DNA replication protein DnaC